MYQPLQVCGNCGNASFDPGFLPALFDDGLGAKTQICKECVDWLKTRNGLYELREEIKHPAVLRVIKGKKVTDYESGNNPA